MEIEILRRGSMIGSRLCTMLKGAKYVIRHVQDVKEDGTGELI